MSAAGRVGTGDHVSHERRRQCLTLRCREVGDYYKYKPNHFLSLNTWSSWTRLANMSPQFSKVIQQSTVFGRHSLFNWPAQIIQSYAGECLSNFVDCLMLQGQVTKTYNQLFLANPTDQYAHRWKQGGPVDLKDNSHEDSLHLIVVCWTQSYRTCTSRREKLASLTILKCIFYCQEVETLVTNWMCALNMK